MSPLAEHDPSGSGQQALAVLRKIARLPVADVVAAAVAWLTIGAAAAVIEIVPFSSLEWLFGRPMGAIDFYPLANQKQLNRARFVRRAIARAATIAPFRADCLPQAMAAAIFCRGLGVPVATHLGVKRGAGSTASIAAHAWSASGAIAITGGRGWRDYGTVACYLLAGRQ